VARDVGAGDLGDEAVAVAGTVEGGVAGVLVGDFQGEDERFDEARVEAASAWQGSRSAGLD
jgi:hypothetical protein